MTLLFGVLSSYTIFVISRHGLDFLPIFFGDIALGGWPGQFNADFMTMLILSALWTAWRNGFTVGAIGLGFLAFNFGGAFLSLYLLWLSFQHHGDVTKILLGQHVLKDNIR